MAKLPRKITRKKPVGKIVITPRDRLILEWVYRYRFLTTDHIQIITATPGRKKLNKRLQQLFDFKYLDRPPVQERLYSYADKRPTVHALGNGLVSQKFRLLDSNIGHQGDRTWHHDTEWNFAGKRYV